MIKTGRSFGGNWVGSSFSTLWFLIFCETPSPATPSLSQNSRYTPMFSTFLNFSLLPKYSHHLANLKSMELSGFFYLVFEEEILVSLFYTTIFWVLLWFYLSLRSSVLALGSFCFDLIWGFVHEPACWSSWKSTLLLFPPDFHPSSSLLFQSLTSDGRFPKWFVGLLYLPPQKS